MAGGRHPDLLDGAAALDVGDLACFAGGDADVGRFLPTQPEFARGGVVVERHDRPCPLEPVKFSGLSERVWALESR